MDIEVERRTIEIQAWILDQRGCTRRYLAIEGAYRLCFLGS